MNHTITVTIQNSKNKQEAVYSDGYYIYIKSTLSYTVQQSVNKGKAKFRLCQSSNCSGRAVTNLLLKSNNISIF